MQEFYSSGAVNVLQQLHPYDRPHGAATFPVHWDSAAGRISTGESIGAWFRRCVAAMPSREVESCEVEPNIGVFGRAEWNTRRGVRALTYMNLQVVVVLEGDLTTLYSSSDVDAPIARYYRLDHDSGAIGSLFTHPIPHIHCYREDSPRFMLESHDTNGVLLEFLDFLYRNHFHDRWLAWAHNVYLQDLDDRGRSIVDDDLFARIVDAFDKGSIEDVREKMRDEVSFLKGAIRRALDQAYPLRISPDDKGPLCYVG
jgi:hypothetical protein